MTWTGWLLLFLGFLVLAMGMPGSCVFASLAGGALAACVGTALGLPGLGGWGLFLGGALLLLGCLVPGVRRRLGRWCRRRAPRSACPKDRRPFHAPEPDPAAGRWARVVEGVDPRSGRGRVQLNPGGEWPAMADEPIPAGTWVEVLAVHHGRIQVRAVLRTARY
jgi:membrane protein implicated in regulation of membrane protease activity